jgi:hypothetical protein
VWRNGRANRFLNASLAGLGSSRKTTRGTACRDQGLARAKAGDPTRPGGTR